MKLRVKRHAVTQPLDESYRLIPLTQGQNAIVDVEDFEWLNRFNWYAHWNKSRSFYAVRMIDRNLTGMHRFIMDCHFMEQVDHKDHDTLNNRRNNLRKCSHIQNLANTRKQGISTSPFKGVSLDKRVGVWRACIRYGGKRHFIGHFTTPEEAARAYDAAAKLYFGEFALLNFP